MKKLLQSECSQFRRYDPFKILKQKKFFSLGIFRKLTTCGNTLKNQSILKLIEMYRNKKTHISLIELEKIRKDLW